MDMEKVIKGLEVCLKNIDQQDCPNDCPYLSDCSKYENRVVFQPLMRDALTLLKEQEAKKVLQIRNVAYRTIGYCPSCGRGLDSYEDGNSGDHITNYCYNCGQAVKWE